MLIQRKHVGLHWHSGTLSYIELRAQIRTNSTTVYGNIINYT